VNRTADGLAFVKLISMVALIGILMAFAMPRFLTVRKQTYKLEARGILQEAKTLAWVYYQEHDAFDGTPGMTRAGLAMPEGAHWHAPEVVADGAAAVRITLRGAVAPLAGTDSVWITVSSDGTSEGGSSF